MKANNSNDYYLLDKAKAQDLFQKYSVEIFGSQSQIHVLDLKRSNTYNPDNYNIYYLLELDGNQRKIRLSTSRILSKKDDFLLMNYFFKNGFQNSQFIVPKPLAYLEQENIFIYEDVLGHKFSDLLSEIDDLNSRVNSAATLLKNIHGIANPDFELKSSDFIFENYNYQLIEDAYPALRGKLAPLINGIKEKLIVSPLDFCHGDYNPNNLLFQNDKIVVIDFGSSCFLKKELDLASFLVHLEIMLQKINKASLFTELKKSFLSQYGSYNEDYFQSLSFVINLRLLEIAMVYPWADYNEETQPFIYNLLEKNMAKQ